jgi:hypothetical protein
MYSKNFRAKQNEPERAYGVPLSPAPKIASTPEKVAEVQAKARESAEKFKANPTGYMLGLD